MKPEFTGIHHTAFATNDIEGTVRFWRDLLGARLVYAYGRPGYRQYFFQISGNNRISFFAWDDVEPIPLRRHGDPVKGPFIFDHISIGVTDTDTLWDLMARLDAAGFPCSDVIDHGCFLSIYSYDPNGIPIEFSTDVPGLDLFWNPVMEDRASDSDFLSRPNPVPGQWPDPEPIDEEERIIVPGEGKDNFPERDVAKKTDVTGEKCIKVRAVMTRKVRVAREEDSIRKVAKILSGKRISGMPVVDADNRLIGVISEKDILEEMFPGYADLREDPERATDFQAMEGMYAEVLQHTVGDLMVRTVFSVGAEEPAIKAAVQMDIHHIRRIPVVDDKNRLMGVVSRGDIHKAIFKRQLGDD